MLKKQEISNAIKYFLKERDDALYCLKLNKNSECTRFILKKIENYEIAIKCMRKNLEIQLGEEI